MNAVEERKKLFLKIFLAAKRKYGSNRKRLSAEGWKEAWQTLIATTMSAQSRDNLTIKIAEALFKKYYTLDKLSHARYEDVLKIFKSLNYNKTKAKHVIAAAKLIIKDFHGKVPNNMEDLLKLPGVGRKVANIALLEVYNKPVIAVDTHVHRLSNVLGLVNTKTPEQTEKELMNIVPEKYRAQTNWVFVTWGQQVPGRDRKKLFASLGIK